MAGKTGASEGAWACKARTVNMETFFRKRRREMGEEQGKTLTQLDIAKAMNFAWSPSSIAFWERGAASPRVSDAPALAKVYGITVKEMEAAIGQHQKLVDALRQKAKPVPA